MPFERILAFFCLALLLAMPARATSVLPLYLDEIVDTSEVAFEGLCTGNRVERDAQTGLVVTYTTFLVHDALKGKPASTHVIKQVGGQLATESVAYEIQGVPKFTPGERYVVFLAGKSSKGFSSPIGLAQGRFSVFEDDTPRVANGRDFRELTRHIPAGRMPARVAERLQGELGPVREIGLDDFKAMVRGHVGRPR